MIKIGGGHLDRDLRIKIADKYIFCKKKMKFIEIFKEFILSLPIFSLKSLNSLAYLVYIVIIFIKKMIDYH